jgi:hypothetical protein
MQMDLQGHDQRGVWEVSWLPLQKFVDADVGFDLGFSQESLNR